MRVGSDDDSRARRAQRTFVSPPRAWFRSSSHAHSTDVAPSDPPQRRIVSPASSFTPFFEQVDDGMYVMSRGAPTEYVYVSMLGFAEFCAPPSATLSACMLILLWHFGNVKHGCPGSQTPRRLSLRLLPAAKQR